MLICMCQMAQQLPYAGPHTALSTCAHVVTAGAEARRLRSVDEHLQQCWAAVRSAGAAAQVRDVMGRRHDS
jgi:hypothetical protein